MNTSPLIHLAEAGLLHLLRREEDDVVWVPEPVAVEVRAYGESDPEFSGLLLTGWTKAREDKQYRLTMAWLREQSRLSIQEIVAEGVTGGAFRSNLDAGAFAAIILGAAEGCLLQAPSHGGPVPPASIVTALLRLAAPPAALGGA